MTEQEMGRIAIYLRESSTQKDDDLTFPNQDYLTLTMNLKAAIGKPSCLGCTRNDNFHFDDCPESPTKLKRLI